MSPIKFKSQRRKTMFGINLGPIDDVLGGLGLDKLVETAAPLAASAFLGPVAGPLAVEALPLVEKFLGGSSDAVVRDHRSVFQVPQSSVRGGSLVDIFAQVEQRKDAAIQGMADPDPVKAFKAKQDYEAAQRVEDMLASVDNAENELRKKLTQVS
jgi:hypothetical protein